MLYIYKLIQTFNIKKLGNKMDNRPYSQSIGSLSIKDLLTHVDCMYAEVDRCAIFISSEDLEAKVATVQSMIKDIQSVAKYMADISNEINQIAIFKKKQFDSNKRNNQITKYVNPYPQSRDHAVVRVKYADVEHEIAPNVSIPVCVVENESSIPITHIYYIKQLNTYAINIDGVLIKGEVCDILPYGSARTAICSYGDACKRKLTCQYYHEKDGLKRAFTPGSWIYNDTALRTRPAKYYTRHIGNRARLGIDMKLMSKSHYTEEVKTRECQLIHDLLIYMALNKHGMLADYKQW